MINKTKSIAQQDENVSAVFMYGSFTKNEGDETVKNSVSIR